jgi:low temperature requirement protein LtrA
VPSPAPTEDPAETGAETQTASETVTVTETDTVIETVTVTVPPPGAERQGGAQATPVRGADRHLRARDGEAQETTTVELFFDLVYVLAITQLSHLLLTHGLTWTSVWHMSFLLLVVWWAWIYTTWMVNWLDPESTPVRLLILGVGLASLLMAAALPEAFTQHAVLFVCAYVGLQVGRNVGGALLLRREHPLGETFTRLLVWSLVAGVLWFAGAFLAHGERLVLWAPALAIELAAPLLWYWVPGLGRIQVGHPVEGSHFAERCQGFIIIALGESIVVTGTRAAAAGLTPAVVGALAVAFLQTSALWWLYFGEVAAHSRRLMQRSENAVDLARDAYTYLHLPIVAGIILSAVGADYLTAHPGRTLDAPQAAVTLAGPILYLLGELLFRFRMIRRGSRKRSVAIAALAALGLIATAVPAIVLGLLITLLLTLLGLWEYEPLRRRRPPAPGLSDPIS